MINSPTINAAISPRFALLTDWVEWRMSARLMLTCIILALLAACAEPQTSDELLAGQAVQKQSPQSKYGRQATFSYPRFSGEFEVGSSSMVLTDIARTESFIPNSIDNRKLQVRFFYPKQSALSVPEAAQLPVINEIAWQYLIGHQQINGKRLRYANYRQAYWDIDLNAEISAQQAQYPVLIFSHGYGYNSESYSAMLAELASKGYIVVAINHSFGANPSDLREINSISQQPNLNQQLKSAKKSFSNKVIWAKPLNRNMVEEYLPVWSDDQIFVIEQLIRLNSQSDSDFYQKLDLANLGIMGHSYGGAAAFHTASKDSRVKALINIDGTVFNHANHTIIQPFAFFVSKRHQPKFDFNHAFGHKYLVQFKQFTHASFSDHILWWQWDHDEFNSALGDVEALRAVELTSELIDDFFARYLKQQATEWFSENDIMNQEITIINKDPNT